MSSVLHLFHFANSACGTSTGALPSLYDGLTCKADPQGNLTPAIGSVADVLVIIANVIRILLAVSGALAIIVIVVAAIYYITSAGDPGRIKQAKDILVNVVTGLVIITVAYALMTYVASFF